MSDALGYLVKARPEAMGGYLKFLKEAGKHLDPKTRDLISVITKVHSQTERGFRQYFTRALRNGCKPEEILDAMLMAFPALGLAKIVWAVDLILAMDIPEFRVENFNATSAWHTVGPMIAIKDGDVTYLDSDGRSLFVHREGEEIRVYDSRCPHQVTNIPELALKDGRLTCPKHQWCFDIASGDCVEVGNRPLKRFEHRVAQGVLEAYW